ncbi:MAG: T9SS type A sorting domain-containing protein [Chitinophagales bacterium]|nr:T9SS type A sorting domain-containing protein [Chitinophagales bacterium]
MPSDFISGTNSVNVRPTSVFFLEPGENSISFTNNFFWDGVSNIVLEFCHGPLVSNDPIEIVYSSGLPNGIGLIKDSSTACNALTGSRVSLRPNFRFFGNCNYTDSIVTFLWSQNSSNIGTNNDSLIVNVDLMGGLFARYILNYTDKFGCSFIDSTQIDQQTSNLSVNAAFLDNNTPCFLDSLQISLDFSGGCRPYNVSYKLAKTFGGNKTPLSLSPTNKFIASQAKGYVYVDISDFAGNTLNNYFIDSFILPDTFIAVHDTTCGHGSVTLGYVGTPLLQANWYKEKNSFTSVNSGNTFTIANLTQTDTFYVSNVASISNGSFGLSNPFIGDTFSANSGSIAMEFHISKPLILQSIDIYPYEPVGTNAAIGIYDDQNNLLSRVNYVTNVSNGIGLPISAQTIFINLGLIQGTYYLKQIDSINLLGTSNGFTLPLVNPFGVISTNSLANNSNYFFYNYQYEYVCEGPRTEVYAVVVPPPIIELDKSSIQICDANTNTTTELVKLTKTDPVYNQFSWSSNNRGSATGSSTSGWFLTTVGMGPDIFTLTASSTRLNCINYASIAVHPVPYNASRDIEVAQAHHCLSGSTKLTLVGGPVIGASYQWEQSDDLSNWTNIDGATGIQYSTPVITDTTYYRVRLYCQGTEILPNISPVNPDTVFVHNPSILSVTHDTVCGMRGALLEAVSTTGKVAWFDKNNFPISSSPTLFMSVTENDTFYASAKTDPLIPSNLIASKNPIFWNTNHTGQGVMFSLTPLNDIIVDSIYVRTDEPSPLQYVYIYKKSGTYKGFETNSSSWTSIDTVLASLVTSFRGNYLAIPIKSNLLSLNLNEQISLFLDFNAASSSTISPGIQDQYLNSDLMIQSGSAVSTNFTSFTADRGFTGQIIYRKPCISPKIPVYITYINPPDFILNLEKDTVCINEISDTLRIVSPIGNYDSYFVSGFPSNYTSFGDLVADGYTVIKPNELMAHSLSIVAEQSSGDQCLMTNSFELIVNDTPSSIVFAHAKTIDLCYDSVYRISAMSGTRLTEEIGVGFTPLDDLTSPFYNSPSSSLNQRLHYLVLASELTAAGFQKGNLNSLALKVVAQNSGIYSNFSIGLAHTSISDLTTNFSTFTGNQVFNTLNYTPILGWNNFVFNSPFVWDGVSNILVEMCYLSNPGLSSSVESVSIPAIPNPTNHSTNGNCTSATTGTLTTMRPKFRFVQDNTFPIYWTPATGLYSDAAMTIPYNSNNHSEVIYASPLDTISYLVYSENESKCRNFDTFTINVIPPVQISKNLPKLIEACEKTPVSFSFYALNHTQIQWYYGKTKATMAPLGPLAAKSDSVKNFPIISLNDSGFYVAELISANNCHRFFTDTIQVKVYPEIILQGTSPNTTICEGKQIDVFAHADNYQSLTWHRYNSLVTETLSNSSETYEKPLANLSDSGFYYVTYKAFSFCEDKVSDTFYISVLPNININSVPVNDTVCVGNSRTFTYDAVGVTQYKWFRNNILLTNNSNNLNLSSITLNDSGLYRVELVGGAGCPSSIQEFRLTVRGNVAKLNSISDAQICESSDFTLSAGSIALFDSSYRWYYAPTASGPYMLLANQNKRDLNFPSFQSSDAGFYYYESLAYSPCASSPLDTFELDFIPRPSFTSIPSDQSVCANDSIILTVSADNVASYKWIKDGNELIGRNTDTLIIKGFPANVGTYRVIAMSGNTCLNDTSLNFNIKVDQPIQITKNLPKFDSTCLGNELNLSVVPSGYNQYNFKWYKNNITISTDSVYTIPKATLDENASYFVIVSVNATACPTVISDTVKYTVNLPINQISDLIDTTICLGSNFTYAIEAEHVKAYKWYRNGSLVSAPLAQYVINNANISNQGTYHVVLEGLKGCNNLTSSNSKLLVDSNSGFSINLPKIDSICINNNYKLAVVPVNLNGSKFQFSWHYNNSFLTNDSVFTINTAQLNQTGQYYVKVKSLSGVCGEFISDTLRLVVNPEVRKPIITGPNLACELSTNTLLASNVINHSGVNWFKVGGVTPIHYSNPLDNKYTAQWTENYTGQYIAVGLGLKGCSNVTSDTFAVKVQKAVKIVNQPLSRVYNVGDSLILYSKAENAKQSFWIKDGVILPGKDKDSLIIYPMSLTDTGNYQRYFIGESPCNDTLKSRIALVTTDRCPRIVSPPVSTINICEGQEFSLNIYALGVQRYQWFLNGIPLPLGIQENYSIRSAESNDEGIYHVELYGRPGFGCSMVMSNKTLVTVVKKPQIYKSLEPPKYCNPIGHEFKIDANFSAGFSWYLNGLRIKDSINNTFTITNTNSISPNGDVFQVEVVGNSPCTSVFSDTIRVLNRDPAIRVALASETALNLAPQCEDIDGFTYYAQRNSPNVFLFAINHKGNQVDFSPDLYVNSGETIINYSAYNFNYGYIFGKRLFNVDVVRGDLTSSYDIRFFYEPQNFDNVLRSFNSMKNLFEAQGKIVRNLFDINAWFLSTQIPFTSALLRNFSQPINFTYMYALNPDRGTKGNIPYVDIKGLFADNGGGTNIVKFQVNSRSSQITDIEDMDISIYPNPSNTGLFTVNMMSPILKSFNFQVYDMTGRKVYEQTQDKHSFETSFNLNLENLSNGNYQLVISNEDYQQAYKLTILK